MKKLVALNGGNEMWNLLNFKSKGGEKSRSSTSMVSCLLVIACNMSPCARSENT